MSKCPYIIPQIQLFEDWKIGPKWIKTHVTKQKPCSIYIVYLVDNLYFYYFYRQLEFQCSLNYLIYVIKIIVNKTIFLWVIYMLHLFFIVFTHYISWWVFYFINKKFALYLWWVCFFLVYFHSASVIAKGIYLQLFMDVNIKSSAQNIT